jgi:hypothetical protein
MSLRRELATVGLVLAGGFAASAGLLVLMTREATLPGETPRPRRDLLQEIMLTFQSGAQEVAEMRRAADVVVDRQPDGTLLVCGRALKGTVRLASAHELRGLLRTLPTPGMAVLTVSFRPSYRPNRNDRTFPSTPPEAVAAREELAAILAEAGFHEGRSALRGFLPLR